MFRRNADDVTTFKGRINLVELHEVVNVDLSRVEDAVNKLCAEDGQYNAELRK